MKSRVIAVTAFVLVILGLLATVSVFAFEQTIRDWGDPEVFALGSLAICLTGCGLGWASFRFTEGKAGAIIEVFSWCSSHGSLSVLVHPSSLNEVPPFA